MQLNVGTYTPGVAITPSDTTLITFRGILVSCTVAGNVVLNPQQTGTGANVTIALPTGIYTLPLALDQGRVMSTGLTATATFVSLQ